MPHHAGRCIWCRSNYMGTGVVGAVQEERYQGCYEDDGCYCREPAPHASPLRNSVRCWVGQLVCFLDHCS